MVVVCCLLSMSSDVTGWQQIRGPASGCGQLPRREGAPHPTSLRLLQRRVCPWPVAADSPSTATLFTLLGICSHPSIIACFATLPAAAPLLQDQTQQGANRRIHPCRTRLLIPAHDRTPADPRTCSVMAKPKIKLYVDVVSPFAYFAFYALEVWILQCFPAHTNSPSACYPIS